MQNKKSSDVWRGMASGPRIRQCIRVRPRHNFHTPSTLHVQSAGYRLKLCSMAYENAPKCNFSVENIQKFWGRWTPSAHIRSLEAFHVSCPRNGILAKRLCMKDSEASSSDSEMQHANVESWGLTTDSFNDGIDSKHVRPDASRLFAASRRRTEEIDGNVFIRSRDACITTPWLQDGVTSRLHRRVVVICVVARRRLLCTKPFFIGLGARLSTSHVIRHRKYLSSTGDTWTAGWMTGRPFPRGTALPRLARQSSEDVARLCTVCLCCIPRTMSLLYDSQVFYNGCSDVCTVGAHHAVEVRDFSSASAVYRLHWPCDLGVL